MGFYIEFWVLLVTGFRLEDKAMDLQFAKLMFGLVWIKGLAFFLHTFGNKVANSISYYFLAIVGFW